MTRKSPKVRVPAIHKVETEMQLALNSLPSGSNARLQYLIECFRAAHGEGLFRIQKRDNWLQYQLLVQVGLVAIARGLEISGIRAPTPYPDVLILSSAASVIFATLYLIENSLIGNLSRYVAYLSELELKLSGEQLMIPNWDASDTYRFIHTKDTLPFRLIAQLMSFLFIPLGITIVRLYSLSSKGLPIKAEILLHIIFFSYVLGIIILNYKRRRRNADNIAQPDSSTNGTPPGNTTTKAK
jgi:hypothetical protein